MKLKIYFENIDEAYVGDVLVDDEVPLYLKGKFVPSKTQEAKEFLDLIEKMNVNEKEKGIHIQYLHEKGNLPFDGLVLGQENDNIVIKYLEWNEVDDFKNESRNR